MRGFPPPAPAGRVPTVRHVLPILLALATGCATTATGSTGSTGGTGTTAAPAARAETDPRQIVQAFAAAVEAGRFEEAWGLLSARWRGRLTPERLAADLAEGGALGRDRLIRARLAASTSEPSFHEGTAAFPLAEGRAVRLLREGASWRLDALE